MQYFLMWFDLISRLAKIFFSVLVIKSNYKVSWKTFYFEGNTKYFKFCCIVPSTSKFQISLCCSKYNMYLIICFTRDSMFWIKIVGFLLELLVFPSRNYIFENKQQLYSIHLHPAKYGNIFSNENFNSDNLIVCRMHLCSIEMCTIRNLSCLNWSLDLSQKILCHE